MNRTHLLIFRAKACQIVSAVGAVLDELNVIEETLRAPSTDRVMDQAVIAARTDNAAETASHLWIVAGELSEQLDAKASKKNVRTCRKCGCTEEDCSGCIKRTGEPCHWVEQDLCSACVPKRTRKGHR